MQNEDSFTCLNKSYYLLSLFQYIYQHIFTKQNQSLNWLLWHFFSVFYSTVDCPEEWQSSFKSVAFLKSSSYHSFDIMTLPIYNQQGRACPSYSHSAGMVQPSSFNIQDIKNWAVQKHCPTVCRARKVQCIFTLHKHRGNWPLYRLSITLHYQMFFAFFYSSVYTCAYTSWCPVKLLIFIWQ